MGEEIDTTVQQAPQPGRHSISPSPIPIPSVLIRHALRLQTTCRRATLPHANDNAKLAPPEPSVPTGNRRRGGDDPDPDHSHPEGLAQWRKGAVAFSTWPREWVGPMP
jgi:hypothetical protein